MALIGITAHIEQGYSGYDHLIDSADHDAVISAVAGVTFRSARDAVDTACRAYLASCDRRCSTARVTVELRNARGDVVRAG